MATDHILSLSLLTLPPAEPQYPLEEMHSRLERWFARSARDLPWRRTSDPYRIWLSEIILQQTQVVQGLGYYERFLEAFPTVYDLAAAREDEVLRLWQGLGYYSRGRNLLRAAQIIVSDYAGELPRTSRELSRLPGIGPYTEAAILSFAYGLPEPAVDGNVYRVISRLEACDIPIDSPRGQKYFRARAKALLDYRDPGRHNQSMIELGALVCSPRNPRCGDCPLEPYCQARAEGRQMAFPIKQGKTRVSNRYLNYFLVRLSGGEMLLRRRRKGDIWEGLYEWPLIETSEPSEIEQLLVSPAWMALSQSLVGLHLSPWQVAYREHRLTHRLLHTRLYLVEAEHYQGEEYQVVPSSELEEYGMPILLRKLLADIEAERPGVARRVNKA